MKTILIILALIFIGGRVILSSLKGLMTVSFGKVDAPKKGEPPKSFLDFSRAAFFGTNPYEESRHVFLYIFTKFAKIVSWILLLPKKPVNTLLCKSKWLKKHPKFALSLATVISVFIWIMIIAIIAKFNILQPQRI